MSTFRRTGGRVVRGALLAGIAVTLFIAYGLIDNAWYHVLAVRGGSMAPTITAGDLIVITRPPARVEEGQVLTLQIDGAVVTHRVVEVRPDGTFVTQGDANTSRDDFTANTVRIVGEYRFSIPFVGTVVDWVTSGAWFVDQASAAGQGGTGTWADDSTAMAADPASNQVTLMAPVPSTSSVAVPTPTATATATATADSTSPPTPEPTPAPGTTVAEEPSPAP
jgi:signal peptidase I